MRRVGRRSKLPGLFRLDPSFRLPSALTSNHTRSISTVRATAAWNPTVVTLTSWKGISDASERASQKSHDLPE